MRDGGKTWWIDHFTTEMICVTWAGYMVVDHNDQTPLEYLLLSVGSGLFLTTLRC